jgi:hypothetical protein
MLRGLHRAPFHHAESPLPSAATQNVELVQETVTPLNGGVGTAVQPAPFHTLLPLSVTAMQKLTDVQDTDRHVFQAPSGWLLHVDPFQVNPVAFETTAQK